MKDNHKRVSVRAIIIKDDKIYLMKRLKNGKDMFYSFAGGGIEDGETTSACVIREVKEEFGIDVKPVKLVYIYISKKNFELFYFCDYVSGKFGTGTGEEFDGSHPDNVYIPEIIALSDLKKLPLKPAEIKGELIKDLQSGNLYNLDNVKEFLSKKII